MFKFKIITILLAISSFQYGFAQNLTETYQLALENNPDLKSAYLNQYSISEIR